MAAVLIPPQPVRLKVKRSVIVSLGSLLALIFPDNIPTAHPAV